MRKLKVSSCPECGKADAVVPILYGYPSDEVMEAAERDEIVLAGCTVGDLDPSYYCRRCLIAFEYAAIGPGGCGTPWLNRPLTLGLEILSPNETFSVGSEPGQRALGCPEASSRPNSLGLLCDENLGLNGPDI